MRTRAALSALLLLPLLIWPAPAQAETMTFTWIHADTGSPVDHYAVGYVLDDEPHFTTGTADNEWSIEVPHDSTVIIQVAGVDAEGRQGEWSEWSAQETGSDAPGWSGTCIPTRQ